jgi:hypothetical protein
VADAPDLRVSDQERERAAEEIRQAFAAGRLDEDELNQRLTAAYAAKTTGELQALRADLPKLPATRAETSAALSARRGELARGLIQQSGAGLVPFGVCTVIWLASGATGFFWPVFVLLVAIMPLLRNGWRLYGPSPELDRVERHLTRHQARDELREHWRAEGYRQAGPYGRHRGRRRRDRRL